MNWFLRLELVAVLSIVCDDPDPRSRLSRELVLVALLSRLVRLSDRCSPRRLKRRLRPRRGTRARRRTQDFTGKSLEIETKDTGPAYRLQTRQTEQYTVNGSGDSFIFRRAVTLLPGLRRTRRDLIYMVHVQAE